MKKILFTGMLFSAAFANSQVVYDFSDDPLANNWVYYDDYNSSPYAGFSYDGVNERISYALINSTEVSILHTQLASALVDDYCVSFAITPTENNSNTFFPLVLTPHELTGANKHPWRQNASGNTAGAVQDIDFLAVEILGTQVRLFGKDGLDYNSETIQPMSPTFNLQSNQTYWIRLEIEGDVTAILSVYSDMNFTNLLRTTTFTIPELEDMNHLYIANCNGNSSTSQYGYLDDYSINGCSLAEMEELVSGKSKKELVKIVDFLGRETNFKENTPLIFIYSDGTREQVIKN